MSEVNRIENRDIRLLKNRSWIVMPFTYKETKAFKEFMSENYSLFKDASQNICKDPLLNHVSGLFEEVAYYVNEPLYKEPDESGIFLVKSAIYHFPTNVGFYVFELEFGIDIKVKEMVSALKDLVEYIESGDEMFESELKEKIDFKQIGDSATSVLSVFREKTKSCFLFHSIIGKVEDTEGFNLRHINKLGTLSINDMSKLHDEVESKLDVDRVHDYHLSAKCMAMVTNLPASTARDVKLGIINEDRAYVYPYLKNYMNNSFLVFLLLHHERQILLKCKKETSKLLIQKNPQIEKLKSKILDCLSIYSFETVSDDAITQLVYSKYKEVLKLSLLEENMSDFIFKLDDEIAKKKDERINKLTLPITILGIISVIAAIMDIIRHILDYMGIFSS